MYRLLRVLLLLGGMAGVAGVAFLYWAIAVQPGATIRQEHIQRILAVESPVLYRDGRSRLGVFFEEAHRQYVPYGQIPRRFIDCLLAAEDASFFSHYGIEPSSILRAALANVTAGRVVQGGSTITQQTAKNLFGRSDRTFRSKVDELLWALRLEYHYSKEKILEFYVNQFFVSGNGRGLAVAARYYFDKEVGELDLLECAFIAGSLNRPNFYNPFIKRDGVAAQEARSQAKIRTGYVLRQLRKAGALSEEEFAQYASRDIPFRQGQMAYSFDTAMDLVAEALAEPEVEEALRVRDIGNVATSGVRIVTTLNPELQRRTFENLQRALSRLDVILRGYERDRVQEAYRNLSRAGGEKEGGAFRFAQVIEVDAARPEVLVRLEGGGEPGAGGIIDEKGLLNLADSLVKFKKARWVNATARDARELARELCEGDRTLVSVRDERAADGRLLCNLEKYPDLQGAALVLREGRIVAMAGGMNNRNFNRAIAAKRNLGSIFKPIVYAAAQQLGWSSIDDLDNERALFLEQRSAYFPQPDHKSPFSQISMSWAGAQSENVATVWLLAHLCDRLSPVQFRELAARLGLTQGTDEPETVYRERLRDQHGIVVDRDALMEAAFRHAVRDVVPDLVFGARHEEAERLERLYYGNGSLSLQDMGEGAERQEAQALLAERSFAGIERGWRGLAARRAAFDSGGERPAATNLFRTTEELERDVPRERYIYKEEDPAPEWHPLSWLELEEQLSFRSPEERQDFWANVLVDGALAVDTVENLQRSMDREYMRLAALPPYSLDVLQDLRDFRVRAGLVYLAGFCRELGIESPLAPVLSFPLGSNAISLFEAVRAYEGLTSGRVTQWGAFGGGPASLAIIDRIESAAGDVIYSPTRRQRTVLAPRVALSVSDILRNVVRWGTGSLAAKAVHLRSRETEKALYLDGLDVRVPVLGKTGTANDYRNAAFVGLVPAPRENGTALQLENGYLVGTYVGFDTNEPMIHNAIRISGALGALPLWTEMAGAVVEEEDFAGRLDSIDVSFAGLRDLVITLPDFGQARVAVQNDNGGQPAAGGDARIELATEMARGEASILYFPATDARGGVVPERFFLPYWGREEGATGTESAP